MSYLENVQSHSIASSASSELSITYFIFHIMMVKCTQLFSNCVPWNTSFFQYALEEMVPHASKKQENFHTVSLS